jgi:succinate dehydrogenase / fumarate reductase, cytochrome b subunit
MRRTFNIWGSTVGKKIAMAVSGVVLIGFVVGHMIGNLKVFQGPEAFNHYAEGLRTLGAPFFGTTQALWLVRVVLLGAVLIHIVAAVQLTIRARKARAVGYRKWDGDLVFSYASRTMAWGGIIILLFVVYHLLHLTVGVAMPAGTTHQPHDEYANVVASFRVWYVALFYVIANLALSVHLAHGVSSLFQTLGLVDGKMDVARRRIGAAFAVVLCLIFASLPVAVWVGWIG